MGTRTAAKCKNFVEIVIFVVYFCYTWATQYTDPDDIKPVSIDHRPNLAQIVLQLYMNFIRDNPGEPEPEETFTLSSLICFLHLL